MQSLITGSEFRNYLHIDPLTYDWNKAIQEQKQVPKKCIAGFDVWFALNFLTNIQGVLFSTLYEKAWISRSRKSYNYTN